MKIKNIKVGEITIRDILEDIKSECHYAGNYQQERNNMINKIDLYLRALQ